MYGMHIHGSCGALCGELARMQAGDGHMANAPLEADGDGTRLGTSLKAGLYLPLTQGVQREAD